MMPQAGSAYAYAYGIFGELAAWIIGWDLILEYGMGACHRGRGLVLLLSGPPPGLGWRLPVWASGPPFSEPGWVINLPAALVVLGFAVLLVFRTRLNALIARGIVVVKLAVIAFILVLGAGYVRPRNWLPLMPHGGGSIIQAASLVFFAFLGFDVVAITAEESRKPEEDVPFGIIGSLTLCSLIYLAVALTLVGMVSYTRINPDAPFSTVFRQVGLPWAVGPGGLRRHHRHHQRALHAAVGPTPGALRHGPGRPPAPGGGGAPSPLTIPPTAPRSCAARPWSWWGRSPPSTSWPFSATSAPCSPFSWSAWGCWC